MLLISKSQLKMEYGLIVVLLILLTTHLSCTNSDFTVPRDTVKINVGDDKCISNCSYTSTDGNKPLVCSVEECRVLKTTDRNIEASEVESVHFETYFDDDEIEKLALYFKWSPVGNDSIQRTEGYLLNISDGISTYSTCYDISTPMSLSFNSKDVFYNDCFGKIKRTSIRLGSKITVNITTLPLSDTGNDTGKVTFEVEVPGCDRKELKGFLECVSPGEPTHQPCRTNCNSYSVVNGVKHHVTCSLSKTSIQSMGRYEDCVEVAKTTTGTPSPPKHLHKEQEWYKYYDSAGDIKIALNFSWTPRLDSSLEDLRGYYLEISPMKGIDLTFYNKCFSVHTNLTTLKHSQTEFFHDCYGRGSNTVTPGDGYHIHVNSRPGSETGRETFSIRVPGCNDASMADVAYCIEESKKLINASVDDIFCNNRSMKFTYHISPQYGSAADVVFCEYGDARKVCRNMLQRMQNIAASLERPWMDECSCRSLLHNMRVAPSNTLYNISLPSSANLSLKYSIFVHGSDSGFERRLAFPDFSKCVKKTGVDGNTTMIVLLVVFGILCVIGLIILLCCMFEIECWRKFFAKYGPNPTLRRAAGRERPCAEHQNHHENGTLHVVERPVIPEHVRVYVIFMEDHELHTNVVHRFCSFLRGDLGLDVRLSIWSPREVAENSLLFMKTNLEHSDKVIVICSEGTKNCLNKEEYDGDMFTPALRMICHQTFIGYNPGKVLVGFFEYGDITHIPELLNQQCKIDFSRFELMKQFEEFYFRINGIEQYQEGKIWRIDEIMYNRYYDPALTNHGKPLKEAIDKMKDFVKSNPGWYNDQRGSLRPYAAVSRPLDGSLVQDRSILEPTPEGSSISRINAAPPSDLNDEFIAASDSISRQRQPQRQRSTTQGRYLPLASMTSTSTDSSYVVTEVEDLSLSPSGAESPTQEVFPFYHPESFAEFDFSASEDNNIDKKLLSNETEVTTKSAERVTQTKDSCLLVKDEEDEEEQEAKSSLESGIFTLAPIEETDDVERHIQSINQSKF